MTAEARAQALATRRAELLARLPRKIADARSLSDVDRELVIDEAITHAVLEHAGPLDTPGDLERVFWTACDFRVKKAIAGRFETVRGRFLRVSEDALAQLADGSDPTEAVEAAEAAGLVREFAETLSERERRVLRVKYFSGTAEPLGYKKIAQHLNITHAAARAADRSIRRSLEQFAAIYTAGELCPNREPQIAALATGKASRSQARVARVHIEHCLHCHATYAEQLRAIRSAAFERKVAALLPVAGVNDRSRARGAWESIADWIARPFTHEGSTTAAQLAASGTGRGAGTIAMLKLAGACMASATAVSVCATTLVVPALNGNPPAKNTREQAAKRIQHSPVQAHKSISTRTLQQRTPTSPAKGRNASPAKTQGGTAPTSHEKRPASAAPSNAAAGGESEFDPTYKPDTAPVPAPVQAAPGSGEFF